MPDNMPTDPRIALAGFAVDLKYIRAKIDQVCVQSEAQNSRLNQIERVTWAVSSVAGLMAAIFVPIAIAAIKKWFGL